MATTTLRIDDRLMKELKILASQLGVSFSTLANASLMRTMREKKIELSLPEYHLNPEYEQELMNDSDAKEVVFVAKKPGESRQFLSSLISQK